MLDIDDLVKFARKKEEEIQKLFDNKLDRDKRVLLQLAKMSEETGELIKEVLKTINMVREEKMDVNNIQKIESELADVIITAIITAEVLNLDLEQLLEKRISELNNRVC